MTLEPLPHARAAVVFFECRPHVIADVFHIDVDRFFQMRQKLDRLLVVKIRLAAAILGGQFRFAEKISNVFADGFVAKNRTWAICS
jgi:hypothetical protein